ncbi:MAG: T9SS type A sorting domain-containing protein [Saprospiraceae bacterium]|nr:T9SS type A sorting domain-containing protein [Saprospiraceae bacterium]
MNKFSFSCFLFILLNSIPGLYAQHKNCSTALEICDNTPLHIDPGSGVGSIDTDVANTCVGQEFNSIWLKWTVMESGILSFVLYPDSGWQDLDFVVFQPGNDEDCVDKIPIRCMAAGANTGQPPQQWINCTGATGLAIGNTDAEELPGCSSSSNNFLAPIEALAGEQYILMINEFSDSGFGYTLSYTGTASLTCITGTAYPEEENTPASLTVYPTVSTGTIFIRVDEAVHSLNQLNIVNTAGQIVYSNKQLSETDLEVDLHHLPPGIYFAQLRTSYSKHTQKFLLTN